MRCESSAPGKLVLVGEYAVLKGAPAVVLAMNRRAKVSVESVASSTCTFSSTGFEASSQHDLSRMLGDAPPAVHDPACLVWYVIKQLKEGKHLSKALTGLKVNTDSSDLYSDGKKIGLGSSAAICTSLTACFLALFGQTEQPDRRTIFEISLAAHCAAQNSQGSGLDIAAASYGGAICYTRSEPKTGIASVKLPSNLYYRMFDSRQPASTSHYLGKFNTWLETGDTQSFEILRNTATKLAKLLINEPTDWPRAMTEYIQALENFDAASQLGIYTQAHRSMNLLALEHRILYKPCGAGGGDLGIAMSDDPQALKDFTSVANTNADTSAFMEIDLEIDTNGVHTDSTQTG